MDSIRFNSLSEFEIILLLGIICIIIFIIFLQPKLSKKKLENKNEHGSSKFADMNEIKKLFKKKKW